MDLGRESFDEFNCYVYDYGKYIYNPKPGSTCHTLSDV